MGCSQATKDNNHQIWLHRLPLDRSKYGAESDGNGDSNGTGANGGVTKSNVLRTSKMTALRCGLDIYYPLCFRYSRYLALRNSSLEMAERIGGSCMFTCDSE